MTATNFRTLKKISNFRSTSEENTMFPKGKKEKVRLGTGLLRQGVGGNL